jgi:aminopeptidase N
MRLLALVLVLICVTPVAHAQRRERTVDGWRPLHYEVSLSFNDQLSEISSAKTDITIEALKPGLNKIDLDFGSMLIDSVLISNKATRFERTPGTLNVILLHAAKQKERIKVTVVYHGRPQDGLVFANDRDGKPSATGDNWPNRVHQWIPSLDHPSAKATVAFNVSAPQREIVVANGKLMNLIHNGVFSTWRYEESKPIPPYCMVVVVNEGARLDENFDAVPLSYYVPQKDRPYAMKGFSSASSAVSLFSQTIAPYPYEKLALIVGATRFGGMENSSAIVFTSTLFDQRTSDANAPLGRANGISPRFGIPMRIESVVAHEIAHQWFGDSVTESTWADLWLSEGFATYFAGLFIERYEGQDAFRDYMRDAAQRYLNFEKRANFPIHDTETKDLMGLLNPNNYEKGSWVLHMLRKRLGDEVFFRALRDYYDKHHEANASTEDLRNALEKSSGKDLKDFFARWVFGSGHPQYQLQWNPQNNGSVTITLEQMQTGEVFLDPVPIEFVVNGQKQQRIIQPTARLTTTELRFDSKPSSVQLDPDETLLKEVLAK